MEFYELTYRQFLLMVEGWNRQRAYNMEGSRLIAYTVAAVNRDPKKSFPKIEEFMPLYTDEVQTKEEKATELQEVQNRIVENYKRLFPKTFSA